MQILRASRGELSSILSLQYLAYQSEAKLCNNPNIPPLKQTLAEMEAEFDNGIILKAVIEGEIVGSVRAYSLEGTTYVGKLMVHPDWQHRGIGTALLLAIEKEFPNQRCELFTSTMSLKNIALYERLGYRTFQEKQISPTLRFVYLEKLPG